MGARDDLLDLLMEPGLAYALSCHTHESSRAVQDAFDKLDTRSSEKVALQFRGKVVDLMHSANGNHVVAKMLQVLPLGKLDFVIEEVWCDACQLACHQFGCRLFIQLL